MIAFVSIAIGVIITLFSLMMIRKEVMKASFFKNVQVSQPESNQLILEIQTLENKVDEMNQAFYDIVSDLEGKYSVHNKELEILDEKFSTVEAGMKEINQYLKAQNEALKNSKIVENDYVPITEEKSLITKAENIKKEEVVDDSNNLRKEIERLQLQGFDDQQIAKKLNKGIREINILMKIKN